MKTQILKCQDCGQYTLKDICICGKKTQSPRPPKYSVEDVYAQYRREAKKPGLIDAGLL